MLGKRVVLSSKQTMRLFQFDTLEKYKPTKSKGFVYFLVGIAANNCQKFVFPATSMPILWRITPPHSKVVKFTGYCSFECINNQPFLSIW